MQYQLPLFPESTKLFNDFIGFYQQSGFVYYLHNGSPIFCHSLEDKNSYRYILASLIVNGLCTTSQISSALGIGVKNVQRYAKDLREKGAEYFFNRPDGRGQCHKFTPNKTADVQALLDQGLSNYAISKCCGVSCGAIKNHIDNGDLKKKPASNASNQRQHP
jgi:transposase